MEFSAPLVSIIIPARNASRHLARCLTAVGHLEERSKAEVLVVDNASTDGTPELARSFPGVRLIQEPIKGAASARNRGASEAQGQFLAFTDSDCEPSREWLSDLLPELESDRNLGAVGGHIAAAATADLTARYIDWRHIFEAEVMIQDRTFSPPFLMTANAIYRREAFEAVGGFDPSLWRSGEDADLAWRLQWAGWKVSLFPGKGIVHHHHRSSPVALARMTFGYGCGTGDLFAKHRARFGARCWIDGRAYWNLLKGIAKIPVCPFLFDDPMQKRRGIFDTISCTGYILGRWKASMRNKVLTL